MPTLHLRFPVWVRHQDHEYHLQPLLFGGPSASHERFAKAMRNMQKQTVKELRDQIKLNRESLPNVLWYLFHPDLTFRGLNLSFDYGKQSFHGELGVAYFPYMSGTVVLLPAFDRHMFFIHDERPSQQTLAEQVVEQVQRLNRLHRRETDENLDMNSKVLTKGEHLTEVEQSVFIQEEKISFADEAEDFFQQFFRASEEFEGRYEVQKVGHALNDQYPDELHRAFAQEELVEAIGTQLYNHEQVPIVILGKRKSGKTTILQEAVFRYLSQHQDEADHHLDHVWYIDPTRLIAGMSIVGAWQRRLESIISFLIKPLEKREMGGKPIRRRDILYVDNVMALFRIGKSAQNSMTLSDVLKPYLQKRTLQVVLETTPSVWETVSEVDRSFTDLFQVVRVYEPSESSLIQMLTRIRANLEQSQQVHIHPAALLLLLTLQRRFASEDSLIGRVAESLHQLATQNRGGTIHSDAVQRAFQARTNLHAYLAEEDVILPARELHQHFSDRLIGQPQVITSLVQQVQQIKANLQDPDRPYGSFLFIGPTGVGKTEAAKVLANFLFTHPERLQRFDMNEFIDAGAVSRLVGDVYRPEGQLTSKVRRNPFCVLLFDEIEKAHPDVHNLLLQVLDEGRLTDSLGQVANFCNTVIIMTSNLGADRVGKTISFQPDEAEAEPTYEKAVRDFFRPEFINRIGQIQIFGPLDQVAIERIAMLQIRRLFNRQGLARRKVMLYVSPQVLKYLSGKGFDPAMGGRALKRQIEKELVNKLATELMNVPLSHPMLLDILLDQSQLQVETTALIDASPFSSNLLPDWINETGSQLQGLEELLEKLTTLRYEIEDAQDERQEAWEGDLVRAMREDSGLELLSSLQRTLQEVSYDLQDAIRQLSIRRNIQLKGPTFQVKTIGRKASQMEGDMRSDKPYLQDRQNQMDVDDFLSDFHAGESLIHAHQSLPLRFLLPIYRTRSQFDRYMRQSGISNGLLRLRPRAQTDFRHLSIMAIWGLSPYRVQHGSGLIMQEEDEAIYVLVSGVDLDLFEQCAVGFHTIQNEHRIQAVVQCDFMYLTESNSHALAQLIDQSKPPEVQHQPVHLAANSLPGDWPQREHRLIARLLLTDRFDLHDDLHTIPHGAIHRIDLRTQWVHRLPMSPEDRDLLMFAYRSSFPQDSSAS